MIIITGGKGQLSISLKEYLLKSHTCDVECLSVKGEDWESYNYSNVDTVIHVAGLVPHKDLQPDEFYTVNRDLTEKIATRVKACGVTHFIYISTMAVYGIVANLNPKLATVDENSHCNPISDYGKSKYEAEKILQALEDNDFKVAVIRVPSIYGYKKQEYFSQYELICKKFKCIPLAFMNCRRSAISILNLCELIRLVIKYHTTGIICPDNGHMSASDYCEIIHPGMHKSRILGFLIEKLFKWHPMITSLFGAVAYSKRCTEIFNGEYRISI